jgi:uncharacterized protein
MFVVDTNIFVYAANEDSPFHGACNALLESWRSESAAWYSTWSIQYEFLRVVTHPRVLGRPWTLARAWQFVETTRASEGFSMLTPTDRHAEVAARTFEDVPGMSGNMLHDAHIAILMREHGIRAICTRDANFHRFPFLEVIDPLTGVHDRRGPRRARSALAL